MSLDDNKILMQEPYYQYFIDNGYKYLGHGYMHIVFEKNNNISSDRTQEIIEELNRYLKK